MQMNLRGVPIDLNSFDFDSLSEEAFDALLTAKFAVEEEHLMGMVVGLPDLEGYRRVSPKEMMVLLGASRATFYRWVREGRLPRPTKWSTRKSGYYAHDVPAILGALTRRPVPQAS